jgi:hypothetical protein
MVILYTVLVDKCVPRYIDRSRPFTGLGVTFPYCSFQVDILRCIIIIRHFRPVCVYH